jgi:hypothetical protein
MINELLFLAGGGDSQETANRLKRLSQEAEYTELFLSAVPVDQMVTDAVLQVLQHRKFVGLHLAHCTGSLDVLIQRVSSLNQVENVSILSDFCPLDADSCRALGQGLVENTSIQKLILQVRLSTELAEALYQGLSGNASLQELSLPISAADETSIEFLAKGFRNSKSLQRLRLHRHDLVWSMNCGHMVTLMKALEHHPSLTELSIQGSSCLREGVMAIGALIGANNVQLTKMDLSNHQYGGDGMLGVDSLAESLGANAHLKYLSLSGHALTCEDVECLAMALSQKSGLRELCLANCDISEQGAIAFAKQIPRMKRLQYLWLHANPFGLEGATAILQALENNWELEQLMIPRGRGTRGDDLQRKIEFQLILNRGGRKLLLERNVPQALLPVVLSRAGNIEWEYFVQKNAQADVIFHLLQAGPAIFHR